MKRLIAAALSSALIASTMLATPAAALDESQKKEFGAFIREYLLANPEIIEEMQMALTAKKEAEIASRAKEAIAENAEAIFRSEEDIVLGNPNGDVTIVEFFDYNCGFCKRAMDDMDALLEDDPNLRFVLKEFPILGPESLEAHRVAMSFHKLMPEKYGEFHRRLLGGEGRANGESAMRIATELGADEEAVRAGMDDPAIAESIRKSYELADQLGIGGTPSYIIGDEAVFGAMGAEVLEEKIANVRACNSTVC